MAPIDAHSVSQAWISALSTCFLTEDPETLSTLFTDDGYLRDVLVFTWDCRTIHGRTTIKMFLRDKLSNHKLRNFRPDTGLAHLSPSVDNSDPSREAVKAAFTFETEKAICRGSVSLILEADSWKALSVLTSINDWKGHEEALNASGLLDPSRSLVEKVKGMTSAPEPDATVLIVGAGQAGLQLAARLQRSNITCLILEKEPKVGDNWRKRYPSLKLHVPRGYCQLLYQPYPKHYPTYIPKDLLADWLDSYAQSQHLSVWTSSTIEDKPSYNPETNTWTVVINRGGHRATMNPKHLVMALGTFGDGIIPSIEGQKVFREPQVHTSRFDGGSKYADKIVLVIGAGNSASDICVDLANGGARSVTLFQRSPTCVHSSDYISKLISAFFPDDVPIDVTDFKREAIPVKLMLESLRAAQQSAREYDKELLDGLRKKGFRLTDGPSGAGYIELGLTRGGGYLFDFGFASLVANGTVKVKHDVEILRMTEKGVVFSDGLEHEIDAIIYATGFHNIRETYKRLLGDEIVDGTPEVWDLDEEGELRGVYRPTDHPGLWYVAGDFSFARLCSKRLALLIKAVELGYYTP